MRSGQHLETHSSSKHSIIRSKVWPEGLEPPIPEGVCFTGRLLVQFAYDHRYSKVRAGFPVPPENICRRQLNHGGSAKRPFVSASFLGAHSLQDRPLVPVRSRAFVARMTCEADVFASVSPSSRTGYRIPVHAGVFKRKRDSTNRTINTVSCGGGVFKFVPELSAYQMASFAGGYVFVAHVWSP